MQPWASTPFKLPVVREPSPCYPGDRGTSNATTRIKILTNIFAWGDDISYGTFWNQVTPRYVQKAATNNDQYIPAHFPAFRELLARPPALAYTHPVVCNTQPPRCRVSEPPASGVHPSLWRSVLACYYQASWNTQWRLECGGVMRARLVTIRTRAIAFLGIWISIQVVTPHVVNRATSPTNLPTHRPPTPGGEITDTTWATTTSILHKRVSPYHCHVYHRK